MSARRSMLMAVVALIWGVPLWAQPPAGVIEYYHVDALGSVRAVTNATGGTVRTHHYYPFGEGVGVDATTDPMRFTGKPRDGETGLDYFGARYYAPRIGRFATVDPVLLVDRSIADPQSWNRYSYTKNNPLRYVDPDGRIWETLWDVGNVVYSGYKCLTGSGCGDLAWDAAATMVPFVPAGASRLLGNADEAIGFASGLGRSAFAPDRLQHASRHLTDAGLLPNWSKATGEAFTQLGSRILENPQMTFDAVLQGNAAVKGFVGESGGKTVVFFVFKGGDRSGQIATAIVPSLDQMKKWGIKK